MCLGGQGDGGQGGEVEGKITCSQECKALLWVSGGKLVANSMKMVEELEKSRAFFRTVYVIRQQRSSHNEYGYTGKHISRIRLVLLLCIQLAAMRWSAQIM